MKTYKDLKKYIRRITKVTGDNRECYITGSKNVENHHLYRVADLARICIENGFTDVRSLYIPLADLNHEMHFKIHVLAEHSIGDIEITPDEVDRITDLLNEMKPLCGKVPDPLLDDYIDLHNEQKETIEKNVEANLSESIKQEMDLKQIFDNDIDNLSYEDILKTYYTEEQLLEMGDDIA